MPNYPQPAGSSTQPNPPSSLYQGDSYLLWNNEAVTAGKASIEVATVSGGKYDNYPAHLGFELQFSAAPGVFELDIQEADTDEDIFYQQVQQGGAGVAITTVSANNTARVDVVPVQGKFVRAFMKTLTNVVNTTLKVSR